MRIDWFTLIAQVVNFLVLVGLLEYFLYGRIVRAMKERESKIASRLEEAAQARAEAEQQAERHRALSRELEEQRERLLAQAREEAEARRGQLLEEARAEAERAQAQWLEALRQERADLLQEFRERVGQQVFAIARRVLRDLAAAELEPQVLNTFLARLHRLDAVERESVAEAIRNSDREVEIRSAFPIPTEGQERVVRYLREHLDDGVRVRFVTEPELTCGVELRADSHRIVWNLESYLEGLEEGVFEALEERAIRNGTADRAAGAAANHPR